MYGKILVGYDGSDQARDALALGRQLAKATGAELVLGSVFLVPATRTGLNSAMRSQEEHAAERLSQTAIGVGATAQLVDSTSAARGLHGLAEEIGADLIVVGSSRLGRLGHTLPGTVATGLMHGSPCAVAIAPHGYADSAGSGISSVVVGFDGSAEAHRALDAACELARRTGAPLRLIAGSEPTPNIVAAGYDRDVFREEVEQYLRSQLDAARAALPPDVETRSDLVAGRPAEVLADASREHGTVVVVGSRGYGPLRSALLGSVSRALVDSAPAPVIVTPRGARVESEQELGAERHVTA